jgi:glycosyltransferase involved in cell wall biosynthesis
LTLAEPRILFVAPRYPYPPWRGDQVRVFQLVRALSRRAQVRVIALGDGESLPVPGVSIRTVQTSLAGRAIANLRARPTLPAQVRLFLDGAMSRAVAEEADEWEPDVLHVTLSRMAPYIPATARFHRHLDLVDSLGLNMSTRAAAHRGLVRVAFSSEARQMRRYEARMAALVDTCSVVSEPDRDMPGLGGAAVIPNGVDPDALPYAPPGDGPPVMIFFGNLGYFHNVEPARFLAQQVLPRVRRQVPDVVLRLVGARPTAAVCELTKLEGVELAANVPDMTAELRRARLAVLPSFSGSGIKNKVLEAFSVGLPVLANKLGVEGVAGAVGDVHYVSAESTDEIAVAAAGLLTDIDRRRELAAAAHRLVLERYTWGQQAEKLLALYGSGGTSG